MLKARCGFDFSYLATKSYTFTLSHRIQVFDFFCFCGLLFFCLPASNQDNVGSCGQMFESPEVSNSLRTPHLADLGNSGTAMFYPRHGTEWKMFASS